MHIREVTSSTNALLKVFRRALADGVTREGWLAVEGPRSVEEALKARGSGSEVTTVSYTHLTLPTILLV